MIVRKRLPDSEFEIMKVIWNSESPITTLQVIDKLDTTVCWKPQTILTLLLRLTEKGYLSSEKMGRERCYTPLITETDYLEVETGDFLKRYSGNSIGSLLKALRSQSGLSPEDVQELHDWIWEVEKQT